MGYIYKITNNINGKVYIGQTIKSVQKRFTQHKNNSNKSYFSQIALYKAFNKYGIDNFSYEEVEEISNDKLDEREKYWIEYYNSYFDGYNSTLGGRSNQLYNWDVDDIIEKYQKTKSARKVAELVGCDHSTIDHILNINGVKRFTAAEQLSKKTVLKNESEEYTFNTTTEAAQWLIDTKRTKSASLRNVRQYLNRFANKDKTYLGFFIIYGEQEIVSPIGDDG